MVSTKASMSGVRDGSIASVFTGCARTMGTIKACVAGTQDSSRVDRVSFRLQRLRLLHFSIPVLNLKEIRPMNRILSFFAALALGALLTTQAVAQTAAPGTKQHVVVQVSTPETRIWNQALNYVQNLQDLYGKDNVEVEIVALGWGIGMLKFDSPLATRVADALKSGASVQACQVTMRRQKLETKDMLPEIGYVPAGLGQIIKRQKEGWSYISG
jgi:intracellular sulfur oxidation DsrE/DsrF family protein